MLRECQGRQPTTMNHVCTSNITNASPTMFFPSSFPEAPLQVVDVEGVHVVDGPPVVML